MAERARVVYETLVVENVDLHVRSLRDHMQYTDDGGVAESYGISSALWPIFGVLWPSGLVLMHHMAGYDVEGKRILEVGCGIALASLLLNHRGADVTATDRHPSVAEFLKHNTDLNGDPEIPFVRTSWDDPVTGLGRFDLIIASDVLYESAHAELLSGFIDQHARPECTVITVDPGRPHRGEFNRLMAALGYAHRQEAPPHTDYLDEPYKGMLHTFER